MRHVRTFPPHGGTKACGSWRGSRKEHSLVPETQSDLKDRQIWTVWKKLRNVQELWLGDSCRSLQASQGPALLGKGCPTAALLSSVFWAQAKRSRSQLSRVWDHWLSQQQVFIESRISGLLTLQILALGTLEPDRSCYIIADDIIVWRGHR